MFDIGDKVTHETYGEGEVIGTNVYVVNFEGVGIQHIHESELDGVPKYSIGAEVFVYGEGGMCTVLSDVFVDSDGDRLYVMRNDKGDCHLIPESSIDD